MSESSLWLIDKNFYGYEKYEFKNSWLFSPVLWNVLLDKYLPRMYGHIQSLTGPFGQDVFKKINFIMNESKNDYERFCWEFSHQQIFNTKDKTLVSNAIRQFLELNKKYNVSEEDNIGALQHEHIIERWNEIADCIDAIDENEYPYFVFKNNSVDDSVERWFCKWDDEIDDVVPTSLLELDEFVAEFIIVKDGRIVDFKANNEYLKELKSI